MLNMTEGQIRKPLLRALAGETLAGPPIWLMRQAGRYLPEYRAVREQAGGFLNLCYEPELASEVTLQPIRRYGFDAAILFADILLIPQALGQKLWFETGEGPRLELVNDYSRLKEIEEVHETLSPVYETVKLVKSQLDPETALIGFAGAPWTVMTYMIAGRGTPDQAPAHALLRNDPKSFFFLLDKVTDATISYLSRQIEAGADAVKIFDSWAHSLSDHDFEKVCIQPAQKIVEALRARHPETPIIGFPRGVSQKALQYAKKTKVNGIAIGQEVDLLWARDQLQPVATVQGNLDPVLLVKGGEEMKHAAISIIEILGSGPHIFNLGHGITPDVDPGHVEDLVRIVKG